MLTLAGMIISALLIILILVRIPQENVGLSSFANDSNLLGSPGSAKRYLDILTVTLILVYFLITQTLTVDTIE